MTEKIEYTGKVYFFPFATVLPGQMDNILNRLEECGIKKEDVTLDSSTRAPVGTVIVEHTQDKIKIHRRTGVGGAMTTICEIDL